MTGGKNVREGRTGPPGPFLVERGNLGSDDDATSVDFGLEHLTHQTLAMSVAVRQGGIEERDPLVDGLAQGLTSFAVIATAPLRATQSPSAKPERSHGTPGGTEGPLV